MTPCATSASPSAAASSLSSSALRIRKGILLAHHLTIVGCAPVVARRMSALLYGIERLGHNVLDESRASVSRSSGLAAIGTTSGWRACNLTTTPTSASMARRCMLLIGSRGEGWSERGRGEIGGFHVHDIDD
jgi:hypothetical protein